mmetsp:Transcript_27188/g.78353  ORF Transcript_27188/g.78353 Transcript_27188/m.78353 type:complete len:275 (-) Transcript_27188:17-841(-)
MAPLFAGQNLRGHSLHWSNLPGVRAGLGPALLPGLLGLRPLSELATTGLNVDAPAHAHRGLDAVLTEYADEVGRRLPLRGPARVARRGVQRDQVHVRAGRAPRDKGSEPVRGRLSVVLALDERPFKAHAALCGLPIVSDSVHDRLDGVAPVHGQQRGSLLVCCRMQRDSQRDRQPLLGQAPDLGREADGADGDVAPADPQLVLDSPDGREHVVVVREGLAHAEQHHGREPFPLPLQPCGEACGLLEDLPRGEVPLETHLAGRAEDAAHGAADLC